MSRTTKPSQRFSLIVQILENEDAIQGTRIDSSACADLLRIAQQERDDLMLATSYNWIGYYLFITKGDLTAALEYLFKAMPFAEKAHDKRRIGSLCFDISGVYSTLQNADESFKYTLLGGQNLPDKSSPMYDHMLIQYQRNMSRHFMDVKQFDSALCYA